MGGGTTTASQSFEYWKIDDASRSPFAALKRIKLSKDSTDWSTARCSMTPWAT